MPKIELSLTKREMKSLLQTDDRTGETTINMPTGVYRSQVRRSAEFKLIQALLRAGGGDA